MDELVGEGKAERVGFEESYKLAWQRGGHRKLVIARVKYRTVNGAGESAVETTPMPAEAFARSLAAPSLLAHIISEKHLMGLPLYRTEDRFARDGTPIDRGTMSHWLDDAGATAGATVIAAARKEALATAFCLATDATGVAVEPIPTGDKKRQPCRRGHYFVQIADRDHVFFEFTPRETSAVDGQRFEVACWTHGRRRLWEAAIATKSEIAREGLFRIGRMYALDEKWRGKPPDEVSELRRIAVGRKAWLFVGSDDHALAPAICSRSSPRPDCTASIPRNTCATFSASSVSGPRIATWNWPPSTGPPPAPDSFPSNWPRRSAS